MNHLSKKRWHEQIDYMKFWPIAVAIVGLISGYTLLGARLTAAEAKLKEDGAWIGKNWQETNDIKVQNAKISQEVEFIYEYIKDQKVKNR